MSNTEHGGGENVILLVPFSLVEVNTYKQLITSLSTVLVELVETSFWTVQ